MFTDRDSLRSRYMYVRVSGNGFGSHLTGSAADGDGSGEDVSVVSPI